MTNPACTFQNISQNGHEYVSVPLFLFTPGARARVSRTTWEAGASGGGLPTCLPTEAGRVGGPLTALSVGMPPAHPATLFQMPPPSFATGPAAKLRGSSAGLREARSCCCGETRPAGDRLPAAHAQQGHPESGRVFDLSRAVKRSRENPISFLRASQKGAKPLAFA